MTTAQLFKNRRQYQKQIEALQKKMDKAWTKDIKLWLAKHLPKLKVGGVYTLSENGTRRRGYSRFVIYHFNYRWLRNHLFVQVGGWWLDDENKPAKWNTMTVYGASNNAVFELSDNQKNEPVPNHVWSSAK